MIGIIGNGFVGNAVYQSVRDKVKTYVHDVDSNRSLNKYEETVKQKLVDTPLSQRILPNVLS